MRKFSIPIVLALLALSCGSNTPSSPQIIYVQAPTATPTLTPLVQQPLSLVGVWKVLNGNGTNQWFNGYGIEISSHQNGEIRGRSIYPFDGLTGLLLGTVKSNGKVEWRTLYSNGTESGSFDWDGATYTMRGNVYYELSTGKSTYTNVLLGKTP